MSQYSTPQKFNETPVPSGTSGMAISSLILGLSSFICSIFTGIIAIVLGIVALNKISSSQGRVTGKGLAITGITLGAIGSVASIVLLLIGMLLPAVAQVRTAARRVTAMNNVRQLALAAINHESATREFPSNLCVNQPDLPPNLSWRVHILPFLDEQALYDQFHLDEPWDSPHNLSLLDQMPPSFSHPQIVLEPGFTVYQMVASSPSDANPTMLVEGERGVGFDRITDGSSNTVLIVEVNAANAVEWTKPSDWKFDPNNPTQGLGDNEFGNGTIVGLCDGSTHFIDINSNSLENVSSMMTREAADGPPNFY